MLETKKLGFWYQDKVDTLFENVNLQFEAGNMYAILGKSGSGKTTFLSLISGLDSAKEGEIFYQDKSLNQIGLTRFRKHHLAIVNQPKVVLLDEPLSALDLKLRTEMQYELRALQQKLGITFVFVTHDQEEALAMSDWIFIINDGEIVQSGTPVDIYDEPINRFVANFIGESNIVSGIMIDDYLVEFNGKRFESVDGGMRKNEPVEVVIRPEDLRLTLPDEGKLIVKVQTQLFRGVHYEIIAVDELGQEWMIHSTRRAIVGEVIGLDFEAEDVHIMRLNETEEEFDARIEEYVDEEIVEAGLINAIEEENIKIGSSNNRLTLGIKGNPNFGLVRTLMIGIKNKSGDIQRGEVWFNELRMSDMDNKGGYAAVANLDTNFADFANVSATTRVSTIGFGALEQGPNERSREDVFQYDIVTNINLGKLLPKKWGINLPFNYGVGEQTITPKYDPFYQDIELQQLLDLTTNPTDRSNIENRAIDYTKRTSINLIYL